MDGITLLGGDKGGIPWCINCVGFHPSDAPSLADFWVRLHNPQRAAMQKMVQHRKVMDDYRNKSCMLCGRTYDSAGVVDDTYKMTAHRVKQELDHAGLFGVDEKQVEAIVAKCRKSFKFLLENRNSIPREKWEYLTFSGCLSYIITVAQETRRTKNEVPDFHGPVRL